MAFQMIHLEIAYRLLQSDTFIQIASPAEFILGSVAPDSVHMDPNFTIEEKIHSHLFEDCGPWGDTRDYARWLQNIKAFWLQYGQEEADPYKKSFYAGICVHCLTDYCNDTKLFRRFQRLHSDMDIEAFRLPFNQEARAIDQWLYKNSSHTPEIKTLLSLGNGYHIPTMLQTENIHLMKHHLLYEQYALEDPNLEKKVSSHRFLTKELLYEFLIESTKMILTEFPFT